MGRSKVCMILCCLWSTVGTLMYIFVYLFISLVQVLKLLSQRLFINFKFVEILQ